MSEEANKAVVRRYFDEVIDANNRAVLSQLFQPGAPTHFPGREVRFDPANPGSRPQQTMKTTLHHLIADGDLVVAHLTHNVTFGTPAAFSTRLGSVDTGGRSVYWDAIAIFRFEGDKIAEEWVVRDELNILAQLEAVTLTSAG